MTAILDGSAAPTFPVPLPVAQGGTGSATALGSGVAMLSPQTGSAPVYGARAWCTFNGTTTGTNAPISGGNVTSVTRNSTGDYTVNFSSALPANYALAGLIGTTNVRCIVSVANTAQLTTTSARFQVLDPQTSTMTDEAFVSIMFIG